MAVLPFGPFQRPAGPTGCSCSCKFRVVSIAGAAKRDGAPTNRESQAKDLDWQTLERNRLGEFGPKLVACCPLDHRVGALAAGKHQPDSRADVETSLGNRHEAVLGN